MPIVGDARYKVEFGQAVLDPSYKVTIGQATFTESQLAWWGHPSGPWDFLTIGSIAMPGVWEITSGECARQVDHKKTKGKDGARIKDMGLLPARFTAVGKIITEKEWIELQAVIPEISPRRKGGLRTPFTIFHPAVALLGVNTIYVERVRVPEVKADILEIQIEMIEWTETPKQARTSTQVQAKGGGMSPEQRAANAAATPVEQWYGNAIHVGPTPNDDALAAWNRSGGHVDNYWAIMKTGKPSETLTSEMQAARGQALLGGTLGGNVR